MTAHFSKTAHTPGPWQCYADLPSTEPNWHIVTNDSRMRVLANVHIEPGNEVDRANAKLITAAPDMLAALKAESEADQAQVAFENACGMPDDGEDDRVDNLGAFALELRHRAREMRKAAISKATGAR